MKSIDSNLYEPLLITPFPRGEKVKFSSHRLFCLILYLVFLFTTLTALYAAETNSAQTAREEEQERLGATIQKALMRIEKAPESKAGDYLTLLPSISVSRSAPTGEFSESETYISGSISLNNVFTINDAAKKRKQAKREGEQRVKNYEIQITSLINKRYILEKKIWQKSQIKESLTNPLDIAKYDDQIDELKIRVEELTMKIESLYSEIELVCIAVEG
jgi:cell division protein FtsB